MKAKKLTTKVAFRFVKYQVQIVCMNIISVMLTMIPFHIKNINTKKALSRYIKGTFY